MDSPRHFAISFQPGNPPANPATHSVMTADNPYSPNEPPSPCIGVCAINSQTQLCDGCLRTLDEIAAWWDYSHSQKRAVLTELEGRLARIMDGTFCD